METIENILVVLENKVEEINIKSFEDKKIMQFLHKKQILNNFIELFGNSAFWLLFFVCIFLIFCTVILLFQLEFGALLVTFILMCITATGSYQVLTYVLNNKEK